MSDDLRGLPPRRAMPDDVRDRLRAEVRQGITKRRPTRAWAAPAAGGGGVLAAGGGVGAAAGGAAVVGLAAGAVVATQAVRHQSVAGPPPHPDPENRLTLDLKVATAALDRCWAAVRAAGKTDRVAPRE